MVVENLKSTINLCWALSFCLSRFIICLSPPCLLPEELSPMDRFSETPWPSGFSWRVRSLSKVGEREDGEVMVCFSLAPSLPRLQFLTDSVSDLFHYQYLQLLWDIPRYWRTLVSAPFWPLQAQEWHWLSAVAIFKAVHSTLLSFLPLPLFWK